MTSSVPWIQWSFATTSTVWRPNETIFRCLREYRDLVADKTIANNKFEAANHKINCFK